MKRLFLFLCMLTLMGASLSVKAQEVTIVLMPGWNWISNPTTDTLDFATALGSFTPAVGDIIRSQWGTASYMGGQWRGTISQFYPGYGYKYKSTRTAPVQLTMGTPLPQLLVTTAEPTDITAASAVVGGTVTIGEGNHIFARGVCWGLEPNPTIDGSHYAGDNVAGIQSFTLNDLTIGATYYVRAYAVTDYGLAYGEELSFTTEGGGTGGDHAYVDLGLPSGLLWATCNVGADSPKAYGDYFAWGETTPKDDYSWSTYLHQNDDDLTKYTGSDGLSTLLPEDDAATANWGNNWRMPTMEEWQELLDNTTVTWTAQSGVNGMLFTANGKSLFLPAAGYHRDDEFDDDGSDGYYWSSSLDTWGPENAMIFYFSSGGLDYGYRSDGFTVRPVRSLLPEMSYTINVIANPEMGGEVNGGGTYEEGNTCTLTATPNEGYTFTNWTENGEVVSVDATYSFTVDGDRDLVANFTLSNALMSLSDDFSDGVIDPELWTYTGNAVLEEDGLLKLQQNVTDQDVHLRSVNLQIPDNGKVIMDRKFMVHRAQDYYYGRNTIRLNGDSNSFINIEYTYTFYYDDSYHNDPKTGIYLITKLNGVLSEVRLCDVSFDTWLTERVEVDFIAGTLSYYMDTLVATVTISGLAEQTVNYCNVEYGPYGWWTGHYHNMDYVNINVVNEHQYVDLGLPSGLLWATCNVGADTPEEYGDYFAWGETTPKDTYIESAYQYYNGSDYTLTKYCNNSDYGYNGFTDTLTTLLPEDDVATTNWGNGWRMPTKEEWEELYNNTTVTWITQNGVNGRLFTASNGNSLFLPAAGDRLNSSLYYAGSRGFYRSSSLYTSYPHYAWTLFFHSDYYGMSYSGCRYYGQSVRPVRSSGQNMSFVINATPNPTEGGAVSGGGAYAEGAICTLTATASAGYTFTNWTENGEVVSVDATYSFTVNGDRNLVANFNVSGGDNHGYVDLGLPSGLLWATCNVGADNPEDYGDYFAWGETEPKDYYDWSTYQYCMGFSNTMTKYCQNSSYGYNGFTDDLTTLEPSDDAATANWGEGWRMPTKADFEELYDNTTVTWTQQGGVNGRLFTAANGNSLFLPAAGNRSESSVNYSGSYGDYWSSSLTSDPSGAWESCFGLGGYDMCDFVRYTGCTVRPVRSSGQNNAPTGAINGLFSVSEGQQVYFSQGNLQYQASTNTWKFAENQYDYVGSDNSNISSTYSGWIDLFGWGTSGYNHGANCYQPWSTSSSSSDYYAYGSYQYNLYDQTGQADWGYNPISNGGNTTNQWRTLTQPEWNYVFNTRSTASGIRYAKAQVNNVNGVILLPDDWNTNTYSLSNTNSSDASFSSNTLTVSEWSTLEQAGAVFLPAAGIRYGTSVYNFGSLGYYWSASYYNSSYAYYVYFYDSYLGTNYGSNRYYGQSVRLVRVAE